MRMRSQSQANVRSGSVPRPMSTRTSSYPRRAASRTPPTVAASTPFWRSRLPGQDRKENPPATGSASDSCSGSMLPLASERSLHRRPGDSSAARASSRPPPQGSPSINRTRAPHSAAAWAIQIEAVVAPAPPHPPVTPRTSPPASGDRERLRYSASHAAASGSTATRSAPRAAARCQRLSPSPPRPTSTAGARRRGGSSRISLPTSTTAAVSQKGAASVASAATRIWPPAAATIRSTSPRRKSKPVTRSVSADSAGSQAPGARAAGRASLAVVPRAAALAWPGRLPASACRPGVCRPRVDRPSWARGLAASSSVPFRARDAFRRETPSSPDAVARAARRAAMPGSGGPADAPEAGPIPRPGTVTGPGPRPLNSGMNSGVGSGVGS